MVNFKNYVENIILPRVEAKREAKWGTPEHFAISYYIGKYNLEEVKEYTYIINGYMIQATIDNGYIVSNRFVTRNGYVVSIKSRRSNYRSIRVVAEETDQKTIDEVEGILEDYQDDEYYVFFHQEIIKCDRLTGEYTY